MIFTFNSLRHFLVACILTLVSADVRSQCDTTFITGNLIPTTDVILTGTYIIDGTFQVNNGITVFVEPFEFNGCGSLEIFATKIIVEGAINGDNAGHPGGAGGNGGTSVLSLTGDTLGIDGCSNSGDPGHIRVEEGLAGVVGDGNGGGNTATDGTSGSGPKQDCDVFDDEAGVVAGAGGAGGGGGGSYGGDGAIGGDGGNGSSVFTNIDVLVSSAFGVLAGAGGTGGNGGSVYGTSMGNDIEIGSGGSGAGGGGRSFLIAVPGGNGGAGGGMILLNATDSMFIPGTLSVNGQNGEAGGNGSDGGGSPDCCSDACNDCGESTYSCGAGGGGGAGGGSGGGILLDAGSYIAVTGTLNSNGGNGGISGDGGQGTFCANGLSSCGGSEEVSTGNGSDASNGGGGGGGRIKLFYFDCISNITTPSTAISGGIGGANTAMSGSFELISMPCSLLSVNDLAIRDLSLTVAPVYSSNAIRINLGESDGSSRASFTLEIVDNYGRIIEKRQMHLNSNVPSMISVGDIASGIYNVRLYNDQHKATQRFFWH